MPSYGVSVSVGDGELDGIIVAGVGVDVPVFVGAFKGVRVGAPMMVKGASE